jgi:hypothetical protein
MFCLLEPDAGQDLRPTTANASHPRAIASFTRTTRYQCLKPLRKNPICPLSEFPSMKPASISSKAREMYNV